MFHRVFDLDLMNRTEHSPTTTTIPLAQPDEMSAFTELHDPPSDAISSVCFNGSQLAVSSWDRTVSVFRRDETSDCFVRQTGIQARAPVLDVCWISDNVVAFVGLDHDVRTVDISTAEGEQQVWSTHEEASNKIAYSKEHNILISTSWDGTMHVHTPEDKQSIRVRLAAKPFALALSASRCVVAMAERKVSVYNLRDLRQVVDQAGSTAAKQETIEIKPWQERESSLKFMTRAIACMPNDTGFAASSIEGRVGVEFFAEEEEKKTYAFKCHRQTEKGPAEGEEGQEREIDVVYPVNALAFHPIHGTFATGGGDGVVALWDAQTKRRIKHFPRFGAGITSLDFSADGTYLAISVSPGLEDGKEEEEVDRSQCKIYIRALGENEAKGKAATK
jgi:cell cycle arrest protein BUB3